MGKYRKPIYHKEGSRFYGKTKQGKYMSEADAIKEGDRASKTRRLTSRSFHPAEFLLVVVSPVTTAVFP